MRFLGSPNVSPQSLGLAVAVCVGLAGIYEKTVISRTETAVRIDLDNAEGHCEAVACWLKDGRTDPEGLRGCYRIARGQSLKVDSYTGHRFHVHSCPYDEAPEVRRTDMIEVALSHKDRPYAVTQERPTDWGPNRFEQWRLTHLTPVLKRNRYRALVSITMLLVFLIPPFADPKPPTFGVPLSTRIWVLMMLPDFNKILYGRIPKGKNMKGGALSRSVSTHDVLKAYGMVVMLMDHFAKVLGPFENRVRWTIPAQVGGAQIFYFLAGANLKASSFSTSFRPILTAFLLMETLIRLKFMTNETLLTIAIIRFLIVVVLIPVTSDGPSRFPPDSLPYWASMAGGRLWWHVCIFAIILILHFVCGPYGFLLLAYGGSSLCFAFGGALISLYNAMGESTKKKEPSGEGSRNYADARILAWFWIGLGTLLQILMFFDLTVTRLEESIIDKVLTGLACLSMLLIVTLAANYKYKWFHNVPIVVAIPIRFLSKASLFIYVYHIVGLKIANKVSVMIWE